MENIDAQSVYVKHDASGKVGLVAQDVRDVCSCCKKPREEKGEAPRTLTRLPTEVTQDKLFQRKGLPVRMCAFCDGDALPSALATYKARTAA